MSVNSNFSLAVGDLCGSTLYQPLFIDATSAEGGDDVMNEEVGEGIPQAVSQTPSQLDQYCVVVPAKLRLVSLAACLKHLCFVSARLFVQSKHMYICVQHRYNITYVQG